MLLLLRPSFSFGSSVGLGLRASCRPPSIVNTASLRRFFHHHPSFTTSAKTTTTQIGTRTISLSRFSRHRSPSPLLFTTTLALSSGLLAPQFFRNPTRNDSGAGVADFSTSTPYSHGRDAKTPLSTDGGKSLNPAAIRQISTGAILGLGLGVVFSALSRMLVLVLGVGIVVWQYAARRGYNIVPVDRMQRYVKGVNLRSAINDNAAFKISFGLMFALTAFGEF